MGLLGRLAHDTDIDPDTYIPNHGFSAVVWLMVRGKINANQVETLLKLDTKEMTQMAEINSHFNSLTVNEKIGWHGDIESAGMLLELGWISKSNYKTLVGITTD